MRRLLPALLLPLALTWMVGCSDGPLQLDTIQVGRSLNADDSVGDLTTSFRPNDTVYVSVLTANRGSGTIGVRWLYGSQLISEREKQVSFQGPAATSFHIQSAGGFPTGPYSVELSIDGQVVGQRNFTVSR
ncbi:MAG: hypothetical protein AB7O67_18295 [Vicinamibacterales bacterium]